MININTLAAFIAGLFIGAIIFMVRPNLLLNNAVQQTNANDMDAHFIEQMIPHHEDAIVMAKFAQIKATHPEIKQLAKNIIDSQGKEINQMNRWYEDWFNRELPTGDDIMSQHGMMNNSSMHMGMMGNESDAQRLAEAENFDVAFIQHMIPHHQMAVMMAGMLKGATQRQEMKQLSDDIITNQTNEIDQMRTWLQEWDTQYGAR